jgi:hypothetical protein
MIQTLQSLRLLPPPANELVPLLSTLLTFSIATAMSGGGNGLKENWSLFVHFLVEKSTGNLVFKLKQDANDNSAEDRAGAGDHPSDYAVLWIYGSFAVYMTMYWGYSLIMHTAENIVISNRFLKNFKIQPTTKAPTWSEVGKMAPLVLLNQLCLGLPMLTFAYKGMAWRNSSASSGDDSDSDGMAALTLEVPSVGRFAALFVMQVLCTEVWFYGVHRLLHSNKWLYENVHSKHHSYHSPSCLESVYVHPLEFMMNSFMCVIVAPMVVFQPPPLTDCALDVVVDGHILASA